LKKFEDMKKLDQMIQFFDPIKTLQVFDKIKEENIILFNMDIKFVHPMDLIITHILVPPNCIRPTVKESDGSLRHDDLSVKLKDFLERNAIIEKMILKDGESSDKIF
jgi:DNA-directed RNA polymerase III subunit RPC1